ncbi:cupin domain-containing protein [Aliiroseovarius sp. PrR006]|nr:cupin domain-containing protein [Aliiroseovarius sp. PrR006]
MSETLSDQIEAYRIGPKLQRLRREKGLGLAQLGEHTGLSAGMLSKLERGILVPTLPTLVRISLVFGVGLDHFFAPEDAQPVCEFIPASDRLRLPVNGPDGVAYLFESLDYPVKGRPLEAYVAEFPEGAIPAPAHAHAGVELIYVLEGQVSVRVHGRRYDIATEDAFYFDAGFDHSYENTGEGDARALIALTAEREQYGV